MIETIKKIFKKNVNMPYILLTILLIIGSLFFFTSKFFMPDDRNFMQTKTITIQSQIYKFQTAYYDNEQIEIVFTTEQANFTAPQNIVTDLGMKAYQQQTAIDYKSITYNVGTTYYYVIYVPTHAQEIKDIYYVSLVFGEDKANKMNIDYRSMIQVDEITMRDDNYIKAEQKKQEQEELQQMKTEIEKSLTQANLSEMEKENLLIRLEEIKNKLGSEKNE